MSIEAREKELKAEVEEMVSDYSWSTIPQSIAKESVMLEEDNIVQRVWLGSVLDLSPSGKIYTPFANSNVERCEKCSGVGCDYCLNVGSVEAAKDELWQKALEAKADEINMYIHWYSGDVFVERCIEPGDFCDWFKEDADENGMEELAAFLDVDGDEAATIWALAVDEDAESITENHPDAAMRAFNKWHEQEKENQ